MFGLFESKLQKQKDQYEIERLITKYGDDTKNVIIKRFNDKSLKRRHRAHWRRLAKKLPSHMV